MTMPRLIAFITVLLATFAGGVPARAADVDLALVLAIDASSSVNEERYDLQIRGYTQAFRNPMLADAIEQTPNGAIAVTLVQWAGYREQQQVIGWRIIHDAGMARRFASTIAETTRVLNGSTSLSGAIDFSGRLLRTSGHNARRRVIDVSGDGSNNQGRPAAVARDEAVAAGITINGLPILTEEPALDAYYSEYVIGGPGAFLVVAENLESFSAAILNKLTTEIAGTNARDQQVVMLPSTRPRSRTPALVDPREWPERSHAAVLAWPLEPIRSRESIRGLRLEGKFARSRSVGGG